jgi:hypothetical protein
VGINPCGEGQTPCPLGCADLMTDPNNCGNCGKSCGENQQKGTCFNGLCQ